MSNREGQRGTDDHICISIVITPLQHDTMTSSLDEHITVEVSSAEICQLRKRTHKYASLFIITLLQRDTKDVVAYLRSEQCGDLTEQQLQRAAVGRQQLQSISWKTMLNKPSLLSWINSISTSTHGRCILSFQEMDWSCWRLK